MNETALKERLKTIATEKETTLNKVWKQLLLERFLARLSNSPYQDKFIFKGGSLLAQYIAISRGTPISLSIDFDSAGIQSLQALWSNHLRGLGIFRERLNLPNQIDDAIKEINNWIKLKNL